MAVDHLDHLDYYELLRVEPDAGAEAIRRAFHAFALRYHPDRHIDGGDERVAKATRIYRRGAEAVRVLLDPERRRLYDVQLRREGPLRYVEDARPVRATDVRDPAARAHLQRANSADAAGDLVAAEAALRAALDLDPGSTFLALRLEEIVWRLAQRR